MVLTRIRLTRDGKVTVKVPGRRRKIFEVLFLDKYWKKAFRNLRFVLECLNINILKEKPIKRTIKMNYEDGGTIHTGQLEVNDKVLHVLFIPPPQIQESYASLKHKYRIIFKYDGRGIFHVSLRGGISKSEEEDIQKFVTYVVKAQYGVAFIKDSALQSRQTSEEVQIEEKPMTILNKDEIRSEKTNKPKEVLTNKPEAEATNERKKHSKKATRNDIDDHTEER